LDDAANETHNFARRYLLRPQPENFPWTQYNHWFWYFINIHEDALKREVDAAAEIGLEVFYVDAGWYAGSPTNADFSFGLGTWRENRDKFPSGIAAFADYVHGKGMKFGLWVEPERIDLKYTGADKEVPFDWIAPGIDPNAPPPPDLPASAQICLGNPAAREWMKQMLARIIRDYKLDWIKWDNNLYMWCGAPGHEGDGNHSHVEGLYEVLDYIRAEFPHVMFENCASGGHRIDYGWVRRSDVQWMHDNTEPGYRVRYYWMGTSYAFPPEYLNSWIVGSYFEDLARAENEPGVFESWLMSRMLGGFGISLSIAGWSPTLRARVADLVREYKSIRPIIKRGKLYHLTPQYDLTEPNLQPPAEPDAVQFYNPETQHGVVFIFQGTNAWDARAFQLKRLNPQTIYQITSRDGAVNAQMSGQDLMTQGVSVNYDPARPAMMVIFKTVGS
ncbi:MAG: alpha-galactosidase, partial [Chloroflexi bacterium]|nr:alpha-galactosidase [Chloroflexota bacterium]